jgi:hypothetical protein
MSRHLDSSPQPIDPILCRCGHRVALHIGALALENEMAGNVRLYQVITAALFEVRRQAVTDRVRSRRR